MGHQALELLGVEVSEALAELQDAIAQAGEIVAQQCGFALAVGAPAGEEGVEVGRGGIARVVDAKARKAIVE